jgi:hypothetical protein
MPARKKKTKPFATEADVCAVFLAHLPEGWTAYAETAGWDILLVRGADGAQVGIQAKLKLNADVIQQVVEDRWGAQRSGPDFRAVLIPAGENEVLGCIGPYVGFTVLRVYTEATRWRRSDLWFSPDLPPIGGYPEQWGQRDWFENAPVQRERLPEYIPDVAAGAPSPIQLTQWKIGAIKIAITLQHRGYLTRADFKHIGVDHRRWTAPGNGWLTVENGRYVGAAGFPRLQRQHPKVWVQIEETREEWMLKLDGGSVGTLI